MRKLVRVAVPVACAVAALSLIPAASASAANSASASCTRQALLLPGVSVSCGTPVVACPAPSVGVNQCGFSARAAASAAVGLAVGSRATSNATATDNNKTDGSSVSASCSAGLALFSGCAAQTDPALQSNAFAGSTESDTYSSRGQAVCVWTGGPVAVFATLTCTERVDWALVFGG